MNRIIVMDDETKINYGCGGWSGVKALAEDQLRIKQKKLDLLLIKIIISFFIMIGVITMIIGWMI